MLNGANLSTNSEVKCIKHVSFIYGALVSCVFSDIYNCYNKTIDIYTHSPTSKTTLLLSMLLNIRREVKLNLKTS
jgi:hypothetical protein